jgi:hypothetical protein
MFGEEIVICDDFDNGHDTIVVGLLWWSISLAGG